MREPIFTVACEEGKDIVLRSVYPMDFSVENLRKFWEKSRQFKTLFSHEIGDDFNKFVNLFVQVDEGRLTSDSLLWVVDDFVGVFYLTNIYDTDDALVHYTFFDRRHKGRHKLTQEMAKYLFDKYKFHRLSVEVPLYASEHTFNFIMQLGFRPEGRRRKSAKFNGEYFDVRLFGILPDEVGKPFNAQNDPDVKCTACGKYYFPKGKSA